MSGDASSPGDPAAFAAALRRGSGRAMTMLLAEPDAADLHRVLLSACRSDQTYDAQCEGSRAPYLIRLLAAAGLGQVAFRALSEVLEEPRRVDDERDRAQIFDILCRLAAEDPDLPRQGLRDHLLALRFDEAVFGSMEAYVAIEGMDAVLLCVRHFSADLAEDTLFEDAPFRSLVAALVARDGETVAMAELDAARAGCPDLDRLMARDATERPPKPQPRRLDYPAVKANVAEGRAVPFDWYRGATAGELQAAADDLPTAAGRRAVLFYLGLFGRCDYPNPPETLFPFVQSDDAVVGTLAARALGRLAHPDVWRLALGLIAEGRWLDRGVEALRSTVRPGDVAALASGIGRADLDEDARHRLGTAVLRLAGSGRQAAAEAQDVLLWLYEHGPCSICRRQIVDVLASTTGLPDAIVAEGQFDADALTIETCRAAQRRCSSVPVGKRGRASTLG